MECVMSSPEQLALSHQVYGNSGLDGAFQQLQLTSSLPSRPYAKYWHEFKAADRIKFIRHKITSMFKFQIVDSLLGFPLLYLTDE